MDDYSMDNQTNHILTDDGVGYNTSIPMTETFPIICYSVTFIFGTVGNGLVIWITVSKMKTLSAVWIHNLAIADFICCMSLPLRIADWAMHLKGDLAYLLCQIGVSILIVNMSASVFFLTAMSIDRCVTVMWPFWSKTRRTSQKVWKVCKMIWILSLILSTPFVLLDHIAFDTSDCIGKVNDLNFKRMTQVVKCFLIFIIPFTIIVICYGFIFFKLRTVKRPRRSQRPYYVIAAIVICFFICWFPYCFWPLVVIDQQNQHIDDIIYEISVCLSYLNSCLNPILYVFIYKDLKVL
ncbi:C3a anaphylatoxin chemotactic receptor-like [Leptodactylus fuscus]|uniref:C3a anaphylatoxin chemotactic receptor-like n=1 Tax=Leptodactylus fuscus TaxID=238119 RepID=UPI003F4E5D3E